MYGIQATESFVEMVDTLTKREANELYRVVKDRAEDFSLPMSERLTYRRLKLFFGAHLRDYA